MIKKEELIDIRDRKGLFIPTMKLSGTEQMATDLMLLEKTILDRKFSLVLRFYQWKGFWISIGKNQKNIPSKW